MYHNRILGYLLAIVGILLAELPLHAITLGHEVKEDLPSTNHAAKAFAAFSFSGLEYLCNDPMLSNGLGILFPPQLLSDFGRFFEFSFS